MHSRAGTRGKARDQPDVAGAKGKKMVPLSIKLTETGELFHLDKVTFSMTIKELKRYLEFATGIPVFLQRLHYLDETELQDHTDIKSNDIVSGGQLHMTFWHTWVKLVKAVVRNDISEVLSMGVTPNSSYHTPNSDFMSSKGRQAWLAERAFVALFIASHRGHAKLVKALVDSGADVNTKTKDGRTPLHVSAAQGRGPIVDVLLNNGADVNEVDNVGDTALAIAERFGYKDGARQLFLYRWQVRAANSEKMEGKPLYYHQQCDTANPVWLQGTQGQLYYSASDKFVEEYAGGSLAAAKATQRAAEVPLDQRTEKKISHEDWLGEKEKEDDIRNAAKKAEKAAKKLQEEKKKEQNLIDKESYDTWVKKQQELKERQALQKKFLQSNKLKPGAAAKEFSSKGNGSVYSSDNFESEREADGQLNDLLAHMSTAPSTGEQKSGKYLTYDGLLFQNEHETIDKVRSIQMKRASDKKTQVIVPTL